MDYFNLDNTEGYDKAKLDELNERFPIWAKENDFNLEDEQELKSAIDKFFNLEMIHG